MVVVDRRDTWRPLLIIESRWSSLLVKTAGGIVVVDRDSWWPSLIIETAGGRRCW